MHDIEAVLPFVHPDRRDRFRRLHFRRRAGLKHAHKWSQLICTGEFLDPQVCVELPPNEQKPARVAQRLREHGAPTRCTVVSESNLDGSELGLDDALTAVLGHGSGTILVCVPGRLGYYEGEGFGDRCILRRTG